jgi:hypothetical protein
MENCPKCGSPLKVVPAGISKKTGRPYNSFTACSNRDCDYKPNQVKPIINATETKNLIKVENGKMDRIEEYNGKKEVKMEALNAKNGAAQITAALIKAGLTTEVDETFKKYATFIYYFHPEEQPPF